MLSTVAYIESDFAHAAETCAEYRHRTHVPRKHLRLRRLLGLS
jgi:hypothetical protein